MKCLIYNKYGETLDISNTRRWKFQPPDWKPEIKELEKSGQYGAMIVGDGTVRSRQMSFDFDLIHKSAADYRFALNQLTAFMVEEDAPFYIIDIDNDQRCRVRLEKINPRVMDGHLYHIGLRNAFDLKMEDTVWEENTPRTVSGTLEDEEYIECPGISTETIFLKPIITITSRADSPASFSIDSGSIDSGSFVAYSSIVLTLPSFPEGKILKLDGPQGKVYYDGDIHQDYITGGRHPKMNHRNDRIRYVGTGSIDIEVEYRPRRSF